MLRLHTNLPELYRNKIGRLAEALNTPESVTEAAEILRGLIDRIVLTPVDGELRAELHGDLAVLARFAQEEECRSRNHLDLLLTAISPLASINISDIFRSASGQAILVTLIKLPLGMDTVYNSAAIFVKTPLFTGQTSSLASRGVPPHGHSEGGTRTQYRAFNSSDRHRRGDRSGHRHGQGISFLRKVVDVGGGHGFLLATILRADPTMRGVLFDLPDVVAGADQVLENFAVRDRCEVGEGSFFDALPEGGDAYVLLPTKLDKFDAVLVQTSTSTQDAALMRWA